MYLYLPQSSVTSSVWSQLWSWTDGQLWQVVRQLYVPILQWTSSNQIGWADPVLQDNQNVYILQKLAISTTEYE